MKAKCIDHVDRISNLPSNVIDGILQHLPIEDVVRTSILSRKWRYMWVSVPRLEFGLEFFENCDDRGIEDPEIPSIITEILLLHNGPVSKFTLVVPEHYSSEIMCLSKWIMFLSKNDIKYLQLSNYEGHYEIPSQLFLCQGLTYLKLDEFKVSLPPSYCGFKSLLELHLIDIWFESGALERLISGCPILNVLTISICTGFDSIHVSAPSLKILCIEGTQDIKSISFTKAMNLTDLTLTMDRRLENFEQVSVSDIIKGLPKIERLSLWGEYYIEVELVMKEPELVIKVSVAKGPLPGHLRALYCTCCCFSQLQKVNITVETAYEHALDLIRFLLANSSSLEILTFKVGLGGKQSDTPTLLSISRDMLQMRRASQTAEVKLLHDGLTVQ